MIRTKTCTYFSLALWFVAAAHSQLTWAAPNLVIPFTDRGWYDETGLHGPGNLNYLAGDGRGPVCGGCNAADFRNFFVFDLSGVTQNIASAQLALFVPPTRGFASGNPSENYELHDVVTSLVSLRNGSAGLTGHGDLGAGVVYGNRSMTSADLGNVVEISLNASAIATLNAATGLVAIGGSITTLDALPNDEFAFGWTNNDNEITELRLMFVPEPTSILLCVAALSAGLMCRAPRGTRRYCVTAN